MTPELEEFAKALCEWARDAAIKSCDRELSADRQSPIAKRWRDALRQGMPETLVVLIPDIVDETIAQLLLAIDQEVLNVTFKAP